ncbi:Hypothetical_protein [Hexamita inflata]|uniref:Hypothetical_protein n=1 Tax=Hexamita inflata TaxID=28002 RepID=A0AA86RAI3_9EUKA|nr:Hypothetical protein HINF_LOCUS56649 [Hexamita inflata]
MSYLNSRSQLKFSSVLKLAFLMNSNTLIITNSSQCTTIVSFNYLNSLHDERLNTTIITRKLYDRAVNSQLLAYNIKEFKNKTSKKKRQMDLRGRCALRKLLEFVRYIQLQYYIGIHFIKIASSSVLANQIPERTDQQMFCEVKMKY